MCGCALTYSHISSRNTTKKSCIETGASRYKQNALFNGLFLVFEIRVESFPVFYVVCFDQRTHSREVLGYPKFKK